MKSTREGCKLELSRLKSRITKAYVKGELTQETLQDVIKDIEHLENKIVSVTREEEQECAG